MNVDILIVAYCAWDALAETLASLARWSDPGYKLTVYENSARNYPLTWLWNRFVEQSRRPFIALCNPDIVIGPGWDTEAVACLEQHRDCAAVSPISNTEPHRAVLPAVVPEDVGREDVEPLTARLRAAFAGRRFHVTRDYRMAPAHCVIFRRDAWARVDGFDERIPFGGNDYDFNRRLVEAGMGLAVATHAFAFHRWRASTGDAIRLGQFDVQRNEPRFNRPPAGAAFADL
jgi:GT2 family glycosyltransferase